MPLVSLNGGQVRDEIRQTLYDTYAAAPGVSLSSLTPDVYDFFSVVAGKSLSDTNIQVAKSLPTATSYRIQGMCFDASNNYAAQDQLLPTVMMRSALQLTVGEKIYWKGPARFACGRLEQNAATAVGGTALTYIQQQYGATAIQPICFKGNHVVEIPPLQLFDVDWTIGKTTATEDTNLTPAANSTTYFVLSLKGVLRRAVQ